MVCITSLRVRGMWQILHPAKVYDYLEISDDNIIIALMRKDKFESFPSKDLFDFRSLIDNYSLKFAIKLREVKVKNPDNPAKLLDCILIEVSKKNEKK